MQTVASDARLGVLPEREHRSAQGFLLADASSKLLSASDEAIRILTFPEAGRPPMSLAQAFQDKIWGTLLRGLTTASRQNDSPLCSQFRSVRRRYLCRAFILNGDGNSLTGPQILVMLERAVARPLNLGRILNRMQLTRREQEVVAFLLDGFCNKDVASRMSISVCTVKAYLRSIAAKMEVSSRAEIVAKVFRIALAPSDGNGAWPDIVERSSPSTRLAERDPAISGEQASGRINEIPWMCEPTVPVPVADTPTAGQ